MNVTNGSLSFAATIDYSQLEAAVKNIESRLSSIENVANSAGEAIDNMGGGLEKILAAVGGAAVLKQFATQMFNVRKSFQDTQSVMEVFLGSSEKAEEHLKELQSYAWYNMFDFETLTKASAQLQAFGTDVGDVIPLVDRLSNIAAGTKTNLMDLVAAFNRAKSVGYADSNLLRSFATKGLDVVNTLRDMGMAVSNTSVTFEQLMIAVESATNEGGRFYNLMDSQFDNLSSLAGAVEDDISIMFNEIGEKLQPAMESILKATHSLIDNYETIGRVLAVMLTTYGAYRTALITTTVIQNLQAAGIAKLTVWERVHYGLLLLQEKAQAMLNKTMLKNPYVLLATVIVGAVASLVAYTKSVGSAEAQEKRLNDELEKRLQAHKDVVSSTDAYIQKIKDETTSIQELAEAYVFLSKLEPFQGMSIEEIKGLGPEKIKETIDDWDFNTVLEELYGRLDKEIENYAMYRYRQGGVTEKSNAGILANRQALSAGKKADDMLPILSEKNSDIIDHIIGSLQNLDEEQRKLKMTEFITSINNTNAELQKQVEDIDKLREDAFKKWENGEGSIYGMQKIEEQYGKVYEELLVKIQLNNDAISLLEENIGDLNESAVNNAFPLFTDEMNELGEVTKESLVSQIINAENALKDLRAEMILTGNYTPEMIAKINAAEKNVQSGRSLYKTLTGREYGKSDNTSTQHLRAAQDAELALIKDSYQRQRKEVQYEAERKIEDLKKTLKEETNLTAEARSAINKEITALRSKMLKDLEDIDRAHIAQAIKTKQELEDIDREQINSEAKWRYELDEAKISLMRDGFAKELAEMQLEHVKRMDEIEQQKKEEEKEYEEIAKKRYLLENPDNNENDFYAQWEGIPKEEQDKIDKRAEERMQNQVSINTKQNADMLHKMLSDYGDYTSQKEDIDSKYIQELEFLNTKMLNSQSKEQKQQINETIGALKEEWAKSDFDLDMSQIDATAYKTVADRMDDINAAYESYIEKLKEAGASEEMINSVIAEQVELTGKIASIEAEIQNLESKKLIALNNDDVEEVKRLNAEINRLKEQLESINNDSQRVSFKESVRQWSKELKADDVAGYLNDIGGALKEIGEASSNGALKDAGEAISGIGNAVSNIAQGAATGGWIGAVIAAVTTIAEEVISVISANEKLKKAIEKAKIDRWVNEQNEKMEENGIFGEDYVRKVNNSIEVMKNANEKLKGLYGELGSQTIDKTRNSSYANPLGFIENNVDTWLEQLQGFNANMLSQENAMFTAFKEGIAKGYKGVESFVVKTQDRSGFVNFLGIQDEYDNLRDIVDGLGYDLYDEYGNLNSEALQAILDTYEDLSEEDRRWMEEAIAYSDEYKEAMENIASYLDDLFGGVAEDIADKMLTAFIETGNAAVDLGDVVSNVGKKMAKDLIKSLIISNYFENMEDDFKKRISENGMNADTSSYIIGKFNEAIQAIDGDMTYWNNVLTSLSGLWSNVEESSAAVGTSISSASQESIDMMTGHLNAMRYQQVRIANAVDNILLSLAGIRQDMNSNARNAEGYLDKIEINTRNTNDSVLRGFGI